MWQSTGKVLKHGTKVQTGYISEICLGLAKAESEPADLALAREQQLLLSLHDRVGAAKEVTL